MRKTTISEQTAHSFVIHARAHQPDEYDWLNESRQPIRSVHLIAWPGQGDPLRRIQEQRF